MELCFLSGDISVEPSLNRTPNNGPRPLYRFGQNSPDFGQTATSEFGHPGPAQAEPLRNSGIWVVQKLVFYMACGALVSQLCVRKFSRWSIVRSLGLLFFFAFWKPVENSGKFCDFWATHLGIRANFRPLRGANSGMGFLNL